jgi:hypothetical protein
MDPRHYGDPMSSWEYSENPRRDLLPHRAPLLLRLGAGALTCGLASCFVPCFCPVAVILGCLVGLMARADLRAMQEGEMDPEGRVDTRQALLLGVAGALLSPGGVVLVATYMIGHSTGYLRQPPAPANAPANPGGRPR